MDHLPPTGWADVARRDDVERLEVAVRSDLERLETVLRMELGSSEQRSRAEFATVRTEVANGERRLEAKLRQEIRDLQVRMYGALLAAVSLLGTLTVVKG